MDVRQRIQPSQPKRVLSVTFNEDKSCFSIGLESGFWVLKANDGKVILKKDLKGGIALAQMMGVSNVIAIVGGGHRPKFAGNKVILWDESSQRGATEISTLTPIRAVRVTSSRVVVALQNSVQVYRFKKGDKLSEYETADNLGGLVCVSDKQIAFPGRTPGHIQIVELATGNVSIIPAHDAPLRAMSFSWDGDMLVSASEKGTLIHVYNTTNCASICEVRRGMDTAIIYDLCFSPSGAFVACTSDKGTLHIFDVPRPNRNLDANLTSLITAPSLNLPSSRPSSSSSGNANNTKNNGWGWLAKVPLLPRAFSDTYAFATIKFTTDEPVGGVAPLSEFATLGTTKPQKGIIGWFAEDELVVVGAGMEARWEKFRLAKDDEGNRFIDRLGWKHYYGEHS